MELDPKLIKAHFFMGQALTELENYDEAIQALKIGMHGCSKNLYLPNY